jgi:hypothetical protein
MKARDEMAAFLKEHYRKCSQAAKEANLTRRLMDIGATEKEADRIILTLGADEYDPTDILVGREDLYVGSDLAIGFAFTVGFPHDQYMYSMCCWMAMKVGRKRMLKNATTFYQGKAPLPGIQVPYFVYDGYEPMPVINKDLDITGVVPEVRKFFEGCRNVDEFGFMPTRERNLPFIAKMYGYGRLNVSMVTDEVLHEELKRLEGLWQGRGHNKNG